MLESKLVGTRKNLPKGAKAVLSALKQAPEMLSARDLCFRMKLTKLASETAAPGLTTVYRSLELLTRLGLVQAVSVGDAEKRYEAIEAGEHSHHLICKVCHSNIKMKDCLLSSIEEIILREHGFSVSEHLLELFGTCRLCTVAASTVVASRDTAPTKTIKLERKGELK